MFLAAGVDRGLTAEQCLAGTGLTAETLTDPTTLVEAGQELRVARNLIEHLGDTPGLGVDAGGRITIGALGLWGFAVLSSPTVQAALEIGMRLIRGSTVLTRIEHRLEPRGATLVFHDDELPPDVRDLIVERDLAVLVPLSQGQLGQLPPARLETRFTGARADALAALIDRRWHLDRGRSEHALHITHSVLAMALPQADPLMQSICEREGERLLQARQHRTGTPAAVRGHLLANLGQPITMDDTARALHLSTRSLRRHLNAEGTSWAALREEVLLTLATELLDTVGLSVADVADRLGYADPTSFTRAFTRWTGTAPTKRNAVVGA